MCPASPPQEIDSELALGVEPEDRMFQQLLTISLVLESSRYSGQGSLCSRLVVRHRAVLFHAFYRLSAAVRWTAIQIAATDGLSVIFTFSGPSLRSPHTARRQLHERRNHR